MIKECSIIIILASPQLQELRLGKLTGMRGVVRKDLSFGERKNKGYMVQLCEPYLDEYIWFIPIESVQEYDDFE